LCESDAPAGHRGGLALALALALVAGCGQRRVELVIHTPDSCSPIGEDAGVAPTCPLGAVGSFETVLERVDGTLAATECELAPEGLCRYEDLQGALFIRRAVPSDGVEIRITGWRGSDCRGSSPPRLVFRCETLGCSVLDLARASEVPLWCECPVITPP